MQRGKLKNHLYSISYFLLSVLPPLLFFKFFPLLLLIPKMPFLPLFLFVLLSDEEALTHNYTYTGLRENS